MFLWETARGRAAFGTSEEFARESAPLAANQGLYNGFLATGLFYGLLTDDRTFQTFFLGCVLVAGIYGAVTVNRRILFVQAIPAGLALAAVLLAG
jgi:putative membrane protein